MSASPASTVERETPAATRYLEDIFMQVRLHDRVVSDLDGRIHRMLIPDSKEPALGITLTASQVVQLSDLVVEHENATSDLLALVAPAAMHRANAAALVAPEYQQGIHDLRDEARISYVQPIFDEAGIPERFLADD